MFSVSTKIGAGLTITHEDNYLSSGISTALQFKTGSTNVHNVGIEVAQLNVLGGATKIGAGLTKLMKVISFHQVFLPHFSLKQVHLIYIM